MTKLLNFIKKTFRATSKWLAILALIMLAAFSSISDQTIRDKSDTLSTQKVSSFYAASYRNAIKKSRRSAVRVISIDVTTGAISTFSGTYIESYGSYFVATVAHGLIGQCDSTKIVFDQNVYDCLKLIEVNNVNDYALIQVEEIEVRKAVNIPQDLPKRKQWKGVYSVLNKVVYTGYPNSIGPLSIEGRVAGSNGDRFIYLHSYAWEGSSGSGVFDYRGKYIGHVVAIDVGSTEFGVQVLNNVVLVIPSFKIDWTKIITEAE